METRSDFIESVKATIQDAYLSPNQDKLVETNLDARQNEFLMERPVHVKRSIAHVIYRFDPDNEILFPYLKPTEPLRRVCDYIIFADDGKDRFVFMFEMKKRSGSPGEQAAISQSFVDFILKRMDFKNGTSMASSVNYRKIGLKDTSAPQRLKTGGYASLSYDKDGYVLLQRDFDIYLGRLMDMPLE